MTEKQSKNLYDVVKCNYEIELYEMRETHTHKHTNYSLAKYICIKY